jgi:hypothetical protein
MIYAAGPSPRPDLPVSSVWRPSNPGRAIDSFFVNRSRHPLTLCPLSASLQALARPASTHFYCPLLRSSCKSSDLVTNLTQSVLSAAHFNHRGRLPVSSRTSLSINLCNPAGSYSVPVPHEFWAALSYIIRPTPPPSLASAQHLPGPTIQSPGPFWDLRRADIALPTGTVNLSAAFISGYSRSYSIELDLRLSLTQAYSLFRRPRSQTEERRAGKSNLSFSCKGLR